eukprot:12961851-Alexandrium_andersonii.AAC.1
MAWRGANPPRACSSATGGHAWRRLPLNAVRGAAVRPRPWSCRLQLHAARCHATRGGGAGGTGSPVTL